jgi:UDP-4-amino-4,6-dideoxy-N-acetyl-beta-L-altrosamine N-acetyltransferase
MKYSRFGITFHLLKEKDIEMVRQWRNDPVVANNYEYREYITPEMQRDWFMKINNINNLYTVIEYQGELAGVINMKNIDWTDQVCEGGIFFPDPKHHQTMLPAMVSFITTEMMFRVFDWNVSQAHVLKENTGVQSFVRLLGYELVPGQEEVNNQLYQVTRDSFEKHAPRIRKAMVALVGNSEPGVYTIEPDEFSDPLILQWEEKVKGSRFIQRTGTTPEGRSYWFD